VEVLQYSPVPHRDFMRPVLDTGHRDLVGPIEFSVYGPVAAVQQVLPGMRRLGRGTILLVNGGTAVVPHTERAGTSVAFAAESAYGHLLHERLAGEGIHVAQLVIPGAITPGHARKDPDVLAEKLWTMHRERRGFRHYADDLDSR
jgi:short-subunit dehydrogenase